MYASLVDLVDGARERGQGPWNGIAKEADAGRRMGIDAQG